MGLPVITAPQDLEAIVEYLRPKATGAEVSEARATLGSSVMDGRKVAGYQYWGFVGQDGQRIKLTNLGRRFARADGEGRVEIFGEVISSKKAYRMGADWIFHQGFDHVPVSDLAAHWLEHVPEELGTRSEDTVRRQVTCFFQLAEGAGLGEYKLGRGGQPTRFQVNRENLAQQVAEAALEDPSDDTPEPTDSSTEPTIVEPPEAGEQEQATTSPLSGEEEARVFIAHGRNHEIVKQVKTVLEATDLSYEVAIEEETTAIPVSEKVFAAMRRCTAAVICVTADGQGREGEDREGYPINENVLIEIGAAFVLYDKRVVLVWDRRLPIPSNLQGLYRCEFEGDELSWSAGMKLMKAVAKIKKSAPLN